METVSSLFLFAATASAYVYDLHRQRRITQDSTDGEIDDRDLRILAAVNGLHGDSLHEAQKVFLMTSQYPSLQEALSRAPILGLYFAAGWCDDCWEATPLLEKVLLRQQKMENFGDNDKLLEVVYVSSDKSAAEMAKFKPKSFLEIPYTAQDEIVRLKRFFSTCAKKEMDQVGITEDQRKHGTPTLILIESASGRILSEDGVDHFMNPKIKNKPLQVLEAWKQLLWGLDSSESWESLSNYQTAFN